MKKAIKWVGFFVVAVVCMLSISVLTACNETKTPEKKSTLLLSMMVQQC